jgi:uncharacterized protein DUF6011
MNSFRKLPDGSWGVQCDAQHNPGEVITVTLRDGRTKTATLGEQVGSYRGTFLYATVASAKPEAKQVGDLSGVLALFAKAKTHLKYPAVVLSVPAVNVTLRLSVAGPRAKVPGSITVLDAVKGVDGRDWFGRITVDGTFQPAAKLNGRTDAIVARLKEFACDPAKVAAEHGRLTGACCFCNIPLKDERSTAVGYGETCASHYGLPWGSTKREGFNPTVKRELDIDPAKPAANVDLYGEPMPNRLKW